MKKKVVFICALLLLVGVLFKAFADSNSMAQMLCELGIKFYKQAKYEEALEEFQKALMLEPNYEPALKYIQIFKEMGLIEDDSQQADKMVSGLAPQVPAGPASVDETLDLIEFQQQTGQSKGVLTAKPSSTTQAPIPEDPRPPRPKKTFAPKSVSLDYLANIGKPIEIELYRSMLIQAGNIKRFLVTPAGRITVERAGQDQLIVSGENFGPAYLHIWDDAGRRTLEFLIIPERPEGPSYEELKRREVEKERDFVVRYDLSWYSSEIGRRLYNLERSTYSWTHNLRIDGPTPYGQVDSFFTVRRSPTHTDLTYVTLGLKKGGVSGWLNSYEIRGFDFSTPMNDMMLQGTSLRGGLLNLYLFGNKINYVGYWGREGGGRYGDLSPSLVKTKHSFLEGSYIAFMPTRGQTYKFDLAYGWGRDRDAYLNKYGYDFIADWNLDDLGLNYEAAYDSENFAHLANVNYKFEKGTFNTQFRDINKKYLSIVGTGWSQGQIGGLFNLNYKANNKFYMTSTLDVFRDRLYPAPDNIYRWNENFNWNANFILDPEVNGSLEYNIQNNLGSLSQYRYQNAGFTLSKVFKLMKDFSTYVSYRHQENTNYSEHTGDYVNEKFYGGIRFNIIGPLSFYTNKEINWVNERYYATRSRPNAWESGLEYGRHFGSKRPASLNLRMVYRDEEDTGGNISFLSGEDYLEGYSELRWRPVNDTELYGSCRIRNVWADNPQVNKRIEADFNAGLRYTWDTGFYWDSVGSIEGYVFKDLNSDGLRQRNDPPIEGVKVYLGKDNSTVTDIFGYFVFRKVKGKKAFVSIDTSAIPQGYVLTVPSSQEVSIMQGGRAQVNFGLTSHTEIRGVAFEDIDQDMQHSPNDVGLMGITVFLDDSRETTTDAFGRFSFGEVLPGDHIIRLDLNSLPRAYLPKISLKQKVTVIEGATVFQNFPMKKSAD